MLLSRKPGRLLAVATIAGLMSHSALGQEARALSPEVVASVISAEQLEAERKAYIEGLNRRIAEDLAERLRTDEAVRIEIASAEVSTQG